MTYTAGPENPGQDQEPDLIAFATTADPSGDLGPLPERWR